jgi:hypothetical protein
MNARYGAGEANATEAMGLIPLIAGLATLTAGWAYGTDGVQIGAMVLGLAAIVGGVVLLRVARTK